MNHARQPRGNVEPCAVFFSAGTQTDDVVMNQEAEIEEERNEQEDQAKVADSLDLGGEEYGTDDEDSGLDSVSDDELVDSHLAFGTALI